jgi:hypothetical protein
MQGGVGDVVVHAAEREAAPIDIAMPCADVSAITSSPSLSSSR